MDVEVYDIEALVYNLGISEPQLPNSSEFLIRRERSEWSISWTDRDLEGEERF